MNEFQKIVIKKIILTMLSALITTAGVIIMTEYHNVNGIIFVIIGFGLYVYSMRLK